MYATKTSIDTSPVSAFSFGCTSVGGFLDLGAKFGGSSAGNFETSSFTRACMPSPSGTIRNIPWVLVIVPVTCPSLTTSVIPPGPLLWSVPSQVKLWASCTSPPVFCISSVPYVSGTSILDFNAAAGFKSIKSTEETVGSCRRRLTFSETLGAKS